MRDATISSMATQHLHLHTGARWLTPMMLGLIAIIVGILAMMSYPFVS
jgi:uncharacterized membrane protein HdeD (DUF308 family)